MQIKHRIPMTSSNNNPSLPIHNKSNSNIQHHRVPIILSPFVLALLLSFSFLLFLSLQIPHHRRISPPITQTSTCSLIFSHLHLHLHLLSNSSSLHTLIISSHPAAYDIQLAMRQAGFAGQITETSQHSNPLPFDDESFELVFSNAFDEAKDGAKLAQEVERMLKESGLCMLLVGSAKEKVIALFVLSDVVEVRQVDGFGSLHTQMILRKKTQNG